MATFTWIVPAGTAGLGNVAGNWSPSGGPQNPGDVGVLTNGGTILLPDATLNGNTAVVGPGTFSFSGGPAINFGNPSLDSTSEIITATGSAAAATVVNANGNFVNQGSIFANGAAGSTLTINIAGTTIGGTFAPGYFYNADLIEADGGNNLTINVGNSSEMFNSGQIVANAGSILINSSALAISGGYAGVLGFVVVEAGGTVETTAAYASTFDNSTTSAGTTPFYGFGDTTAGNTLKIDNIGAFGGRIFNFQAGDTIDLGASLAVAGLAYNPATGILNLDNSGGTILASLAMANGAFQSTNGTVAALVAGSAAGFTVGTSGGDTILTATGTIPTSTNLAGAWQSGTSWIGGLTPGALDIPVIGLKPQGTSLGNFVLTTGTTPVTVAGFDLIDHHATLDVTSNTTATTAVIDDLSGMIEVLGGNTLTADGLRTFYQESSIKVDSGAVLGLTGHPSVQFASINGTLSTGTGNLFGAQFESGTVEIDGALLAGPTTAAGVVTGGANISIGLDGNGQAQMTVNGSIAGTGTVTDSHVTLGSDPTSSGTLTLNGANASWTDFMVPGSLDPNSIRGDILVGYNDLSTNTPPGTPAPPAQGSAALTIENGAMMTDQEAGFIGYSPNSSGNVTVAAGGVWNIAAAPVLTYTSGSTTITTTANSGFLEVGRLGYGNLSVLNGGTVLAGALGSFFGSGSSFAAGGIQIGQSAGATGSILVSGASALLSTQDGIAIGNAGAGTLNVQNGGSVSVNGSGIGAGDLAGAVGAIIVGGTGAAAVVTFGATSGGLTIGKAGTGSLEVDALGTISMTGTGGIAIGQTAGATGAVTVNGGAIIQGVSAGGIGVGQIAGATASLLIQNGGTVQLQGNGISAATTATADSGTITVTGTNSLLQTTGTAAIDIGKTGNGALIVSGGTVNDANALRVGGTGAASGTVSVTGGTITAATLTLDSAAGGTATGILTINAGGVVKTTGSATINQNGFVTLAGGTLNVATSSGALTLNGGANVSGFGRIVVGNGAGVLAGTGAVSASGGMLDITGAGSQSFTINAGATLKLDNGFAGATTPTVNFTAGAPETLILGGGVVLSNTININNWQVGDAIELQAGLIANSASLVGTMLTVNVSGSTSGAITFSNVTAAQGSPVFTTPTDGTTGLSTITLACFAAGTRIRTARGQMPVEQLLEEDILVTASGAQEPVIWIGRTPVNCAAHPDPESVWPVRVSAGAFGPGMPVRDLFLSPDHAVFVNDVLVPVKYLIDGTFIAQVKRDRVTYFHVELREHDVILAEDLPVESYLDAGDRTNFENAGGVVRLHPDFGARLGANMGAVWESRGAAPLVRSGRALAEARAMVAGHGVARRSA